MTIAVEVVDLQGDPRTRGLAHGKARAAQIARCIDAWLESLRAAGVADPKAHVRNLNRDTQFLEALGAYAPDLLDEVRATAVGAEQPFELLYGAQLMDEEWAYRSALDTAAVDREKCSSVAVRAPDSSVVIGQNMDLGGYTDSHQVALRIAPEGDKPGAVVFSISSMIGLMGANSAQVGVFVNAIPQLPAARKGIPVAFVIRRLLQAKSLAEAVKLVKELPHATGQHYLLADPTGIRSFEAAPGRVVEFEARDADRVVHTNHPLTSGWGSVEESPNSVTRLQCLQKRLETGRVDVESVKAALSSRDDPQYPVSRTADPVAQANPLTGMISFTTGSMIATLVRQAQGVASWISAGPPNLRGYSQVSLAR